jgi:hypothetical protein
MQHWCQSYSVRVPASHMSRLYALHRRRRSCRMYTATFHAPILVKIYSYILHPSIGGANVTFCCIIPCSRLIHFHFLVSRDTCGSIMSVYSCACLQFISVELIWSIFMKLSMNIMPLEVTPQFYLLIFYNDANMAVMWNFYVDETLAKFIYVSKMFLISSFVEFWIVTWPSCEICY